MRTTMATENNNKTLNVPNLRFPEFSGEWEKYRLKNIANISKERIGINMLSNNNYISTENMKSDFGGVDVAINLPASGNVIKFQKGDTLLSNIRPYLKKIWQAKFDGGCSADIFVFRSNILCNSDFLYYTLANEKFISYAMSGAKGVKMPRGDKEQILKYELHLPTIIEQNKITSFLSLLDERIATQIKIIEKLESLIKGLCQTLFNFEEYTTYFLGDICSITTGKLDANAMVEDGKYPFFTCAEDVFSIDEYAFDTEALLISGNGANLGYIHYYNGKFNAYQRTYVLDKFAIDINYVRLYLESFLKYRIEQEKNTGNTPYIVLGTLSKMKIKVPNTITQQKISQSIASLKEKLSIEKQSLKKYEEQKKYLLSNLFI